MLFLKIYTTINYFNYLVCGVRYILLIPFIKNPNLYYFKKNDII